MIDCRMLIHYAISEIELVLFFAATVAATSSAAAAAIRRYQRSIDFTCLLLLVVVAAALLLLVHHQQYRNHIRVYKCKHWYQNQDLRLNCWGIRSAQHDLQITSFCCSDILILHSIRSIVAYYMYSMDL